jgi:hypothetical protein
MRERRKQALLRALVSFASANLLWEFVQAPLYTIWVERWGAIVFAVFHCTGGDVVIGAYAMLLALAAFGRDWPDSAASRGCVTAAVTAIGVAYTIFSEWLNVDVRGEWAYGAMMPTLPVLGTGMAPLLQWLVIPTLALRWGGIKVQRAAL